LLPGSVTSHQRLQPLQSKKRAPTALQSKKRTLVALQSTTRAPAVADRHEAALDGVGVEALVRVHGPRVETPRNVVENPCHRNTRWALIVFEDSGRLGIFPNDETQLRYQGGRRSLRGTSLYVMCDP
jgi:hypothetical protein